MYHYSQLTGWEVTGPRQQCVSKPGIEYLFPRVPLQCPTCWTMRIKLLFAIVDYVGVWYQLAALGGRTQQQVRINHVQAGKKRGDGGQQVWKEWLRMAAK